MRCIFLLSLLFCVGLPALSQEFSSLEGYYEVEQVSDLRTATVSKLTLETVKGQPRLHAWFYGQPKDVDWGSDAIKFYKLPGNQVLQNWSVQLKHEGDEAILIVEPNPHSKQLVVKSFTFYPSGDKRHPNIATTDILRRVGSSKE